MEAEPNGAAVKNVSRHLAVYFERFAGMHVTLDLAVDLHMLALHRAFDQPAFADVQQTLR